MAQVIAEANVTLQGNQNNQNGEVDAFTFREGKTLRVLKLGFKRL